MTERTEGRTFRIASFGLPRKEARALAMEYLECTPTVEGAWNLLWDVGADLDDLDVLQHLQANPYINYNDMESSELNVTRWPNTLTGGPDGRE